MNGDISARMQGNDFIIENKVPLVVITNTIVSS